MPDASIIIVNWNAKDPLRNCLKSIYENSGKLDCEIIVVDNASTDGSADMVKKEWPGVTLVENSGNQGFARANNIGIRQSNSRYVCLVNPDVVVLEGCIGNSIEFMDQRPSVGMTGPRILNPDRTLQPSCRHFPSIWNSLCQTLGLNYLFPKSRFFSEPFMNYWAHDTVRKVDSIGGMFWTVRRQAINEVGLLDEDFFLYSEDIDWCKRFHTVGWDVMFYPGAEAIHFGGASSANAPIRFYIEMQKADLQYWRKHHGKLGKVCYMTIILLNNVLRVIVRGLQYALCPSRRETIRFKLQRSVGCIRWIFRF